MEPFFSGHQINLYLGDCVGVLRQFPEDFIHCCVTSPPYFGLRDYGVDGQIGMETDIESYIDKMVRVFREVRRVLRDEGTLWLNLGDTYAASGRGGGGGSFQHKDIGTKISKKNSRRKPVDGLKSKDLIGIPWRVALALQADGWYLRQDIIWHKPNPMPESITDRCTKSHEYMFLLSKSLKYFFNHNAIKEPSIHAGRVVKATGSESKNAKAGYGSDTKKGFTNHDVLVGSTRHKRSVWTVPVKPFRGAHFATFPPDLIEPCILAGCPEGGNVLDPFNGSGTTGLVTKNHARDYIGIDINPDYLDLSVRRIFEVK